MKPTDYALYIRFTPNFPKERVPGALCELFDKQTMKAFSLHHAPASDPWWNEQAMELTAGVGVLESGTIKDGEFMPWQISSYAYRTSTRTVLLLYVPILSEHEDPDLTWNLAKDIARKASNLSFVDYIALTAIGDQSDDQEADLSDSDLESEIPAILTPWLFIGNVLGSANQPFLNELKKIDDELVVKNNNGIELNLIQEYNSEIPQNVISIFKKYFKNRLKNIYYEL